MTRSLVNGHMLTSAKMVLLFGAFVFVGLFDSEQASAQALSNNGKGYGFQGGVGWGTLPSTQPSRGSGIRAQFFAGRTPSNTIRVPARSGNYRYGASRYGYAPNYSPYGYQPGNYRYGYPVYGAPVYGYGYSTFGTQINTFPGGVIQTFQGPVFR